MRDADSTRGGIGEGSVLGVVTTGERTGGGEVRDQPAFGSDGAGLRFHSVHPREGGDPVLWAIGRLGWDVRLILVAGDSRKHWVPAFAGMHGRRNGDHMVGEHRGEVRAGGLIDADEGDRVRAERLEQSGLGSDIALHAAVAVEVVGADVGQDGDVGGEGGGQVELVAGDLDDIGCDLGGGRQGQDADADIAADGDLHAGLFQDPADQGRGRRLAVGAGDGDHLRAQGGRGGGEGPGEQFDVADDRDIGSLRPVDGPVGLGVGQGRAGRQDEGREVRPVGRGQVLDLEPFGLGLHAAGDTVVPQDWLCAAGLEGAGGGDARATEAEHRDATTFEAGNRGHGLSGA